MANEVAPDLTMLGFTVVSLSLSLSLTPTLTSTLALALALALTLNLALIRRSRCLASSPTPKHGRVSARPPSSPSV